jgi:hypothetical protein
MRLSVVIASTLASVAFAQTASGVPPCAVSYMLTYPHHYGH